MINEYISVFHDGVTQHLIQRNGYSANLVVSAHKNAPMKPWYAQQVSELIKPHTDQMFPVPPEKASRLLNNGQSILLVGADSSEVIGHVEFSEWQKPEDISKVVGIEIGSLAVAKPYRRHGFAHDLIRAAHEVTSVFYGFGSNIPIFSVVAIKNEPSIKLYVALGVPKVDDIDIGVDIWEGWPHPSKVFILNDLAY